MDYPETQQNRSIDLEMIMTLELTGLKLTGGCVELYPDQKAIIASGFTETDKVKKARKLGAGAYVIKPYTIEKIGTVVRAELDK